MGCSNCSTETDGVPKGCGDKGSCSTGGCNKLNTYDWLSHIDLPDYGNYDLVEVSFKNGSRKEIFRKPEFVYISTGDHVVVESTASGYDIGQVSLMGELMEIQLKKYRIKDTQILPNILREANERDLERLVEARAAEKEAMIQARIIVRDLKLDMKIGDVEYQGDKRKVTFYYTADGRVDFRELIRIFAKEYKVKIEMRQIGARQESARIGGIGSCGRELCCSTWLTDFKSVSTVAARYQNLAINQSKLSGQCGRLKCCLNYELNTYLEALQDFPKNVHSIKTKKGNAVLIKTDIFKRSMYFAYRTEFGIADIQQLSVEQVKELQEMNQKGILPDDLGHTKTTNNFAPKKQEEELGFVDGAGSLELKQLDKKKKKNKSRNNRDADSNRDNNRDNKKPQNNNNQDSTKDSTKDSNRDHNRDNKKPQRNNNPDANKEANKNLNPNAEKKPVHNHQNKQNNNSDANKEANKNQHPNAEKKPVHNHQNKQNNNPDANNEANKNLNPNAEKKPVHNHPNKQNQPKKEGNPQQKDNQHRNKPKHENKPENKVVTEGEKVVTDNQAVVTDGTNPKPNNSNKNRNRNRNKNRNNGKNKNPNPNNNNVNNNTNNTPTE